MNFYFSRKKTALRGFVLPFTLLICSIILSVATAISVILVKELYFSKLSRDSQVAYYAADNGLECAIRIDDTFINPTTGLGIFESRNTTRAEDVLSVINQVRAENGLTDLSLYGGNSIKCATSEIFNPTTNGFTTQDFSYVNVYGQIETGRSSIFTLHMDLGDGTERCAKVTVNKTDKFRQIISQGYASCPGTFGSPIERAVVSTTLTGVAAANTSGNSDNSGNQASNNKDYILTGGTSWTVPAGITHIKVWVIGGGGGGAGGIGVDSAAGGGGGAGGASNSEFDVQPGDVISYSVGRGGNGGQGSAGNQQGMDGEDSSMTIAGITLVGGGGKGGQYQAGTPSAGGSGDRVGGAGGSATGDVGGGGGGAVGTSNAVSATTLTGEGSPGAEPNNMYGGFFATVERLGYTTVGAGAGGVSNQADSSTWNRSNGGNATAFGAGGGGAGNYGGSGGNGYMGGGGGGAASYQQTHNGGNGGQGSIVIAGS